MARETSPSDIAGLPEQIIRGVAKLALKGPQIVWSVLPASKLISAELEAIKYAPQQERLRGLGALAAVGNFSAMSTSTAERRQSIDRAVALLEKSHMLEQNRLIVVRPLIYDTAYRENHRSLTHAAKLLTSSIHRRRRSGSQTLFNEASIMVPGEPDQEPNATYQAIGEAAVELSPKAGQASGDTLQLPPNLIVVMDAGHMANVFAGVNHGNMDRGGVAFLKTVGKLPSDNLWVAGQSRI